MQRILRSEHVSNDEVLQKMESKRKLILNIKDRQLKFLGQIMRRKGLGYSQDILKARGTEKNNT